jgi:hypothetical protein
MSSSISLVRIADASSALLFLTCGLAQAGTAEDGETRSLPLLAPVQPGQPGTLLLAEKSPATAKYLAWGTTLAGTLGGLLILGDGKQWDWKPWEMGVGFPLLGLGLGAGPSAGHFYAGETGQRP